MKLEENNIIVKRSYKTVYKCDDSIVKVFNEEHPKSDVFNEALITARIEETGLDIPKVKGVSLVEGKWALEIEYKDGKTMEDMMNSDKKNIEKYMEDFVDLQLQIHGKTSPLLKGMKDKLARQINSLKDLDATTRYELLTRLESMPKHNKVCHGDFNPSNVIVGKHIPFRVMSFCTFWDYTILHRMRDYDDPREKNSNIFEYITSSNNRDGLAVKAAGMDLLKRQEDRKLLILLSDGKPYDVLVNRPNARNPKPYRDDYALHDTATEVRRLRQQGVSVLGVFVGEETELMAEQKIFGKDFAYARDIRNFSHMVGSYLRRKIEE